jgi:hypothetical protein
MNRLYSSRPIDTAKGFGRVYRVHIHVLLFSSLLFFYYYTLPFSRQYTIRIAAKLRDSFRHIPVNPSVARLVYTNKQHDSHWS